MAKLLQQLTVYVCDMHPSEIEEHVVSADLFALAFTAAHFRGTSADLACTVERADHAARVDFSVAA